MRWRRKWQPTPVFLPGEISWIEVPGRLQSMGLQRVKPNIVCIHTNQYKDLLVVMWLEGQAGQGGEQDGSAGGSCGVGGAVREDLPQEVT